MPAVDWLLGGGGLESGGHASGGASPDPAVSMPVATAGGRPRAAVPRCATDGAGGDADEEGRGRAGGGARADAVLPGPRPSQPHDDGGGQLVLDFYSTYADGGSGGGHPDDRRSGSVGVGSRNTDARAAWVEQPAHHQGRGSRDRGGGNGSGNASGGRQRGEGRGGGVTDVGHLHLHPRPRPRPRPRPHPHPHSAVDSSQSGQSKAKTKAKSTGRQPQDRSRGRNPRGGAGNGGSGGWGRGRDERSAVLSAVAAGSRVAGSAGRREDPGSASTTATSPVVVPTPPTPMRTGHRTYPLEPHYDDADDDDDDGDGETGNTCCDSVTFDADSSPPAPTLWDFLQPEASDSLSLKTVAQKAGRHATANPTATATAVADTDSLHSGSGWRGTHRPSRQTRDLKRPPPAPPPSPPPRAPLLGQELAQQQLLQDTWVHGHVPDIEDLEDFGPRPGPGGARRVWAVGEECMALWEVDGRWYPARVVAPGHPSPMEGMVYMVMHDGFDDILAEPATSLQPR